MAYWFSSYVNAKKGESGVAFTLVSHYQMSRLRRTMASADERPIGVSVFQK
jgi:hypothetical protein